MKIITIMLAATAIHQTVWAQDDANNPCIVTPTTIIKSADMQVSNIPVSEVTPSRVTISPMGIYTITGAMGPINTNIKSNTSAASFAVTGQASYMYAVTLPSSVTIGNGSIPNITVDDFTSFPKSTGTLNSSGVQVLKIGATFRISPKQVPGKYYVIAKAAITVNYN